ncbi:diguanylate cyclase (GGDEF) domain-containing protein [Xenococcus sp. PCC 7305]|uniref:EAL domain-containing protein n=1 Tax=Xenococcus sp. PCC 7305 TaxID=102125 RepID=UPI0002AD0537|nr:EAL domain-containing protein [Xenococcus sp. PCC 7305]ELS01488.1 diguanylate cyclase (GGDEF) domain-containing protein [Xenococcus sp. PCC 7305]
MRDTDYVDLPKLEDIIEPSPLTISPQKSVINAISRMNEKKQDKAFHSSYILVIDSVVLVGILTAKDLMKLVSCEIDLAQTRVAEVMTSQLITLKRDDFQDVYQVISIFRLHQIQHLPIVDDNERLVGIIREETINIILNLPRLYETIKTLKKSLTLLEEQNVCVSPKTVDKLPCPANYDSLTGLYNRQSFEEKLAEAIAKFTPQESNHILCCLDLDQFKIVNDTCGHKAGDELLRQVTILLSQRIRDSDVFARLRGDKFGLLLHQCSLEMAAKIANDLRKLIKKFRFTWNNQVFKIGVSIGVVAIESNTEDLASLMGLADAACYVAKEKGRNYVHIYHQQDHEVARSRREKQWIARLNSAIQENRFCLYTQKIIALDDDVQIKHHEILLRFLGESGKLISPEAFIPAAERYNLMPMIDRWVISNFLASYQAYLQSKNNHRSNPAKELYAINISGTSINSKEFRLFLQAQFTRYHLIAPQTICFEITETAAISNLNHAAIFIQELKSIGCSIALDDFGSGMSSLSYLKNLPIDYLKIDGSFVKNIASDRIDYATVECFNSISQIMNIKTVAEFVENDEILQKIQAIGINYAQGYGIEKPQPLVFN